MPQQNQPNQPGKQKPRSGQQQAGQQQRNPQQSDQQRHKQAGPSRTERQEQMDRPGTEEENLERDDEEDIERGRD
jgi:hypothetical protein